MSERARSVLRTIDLAVAMRERHPTLFAAQLRADRTCLQLARAVDRYRRRESPGREEKYVGDREVERVDEQWEDAEAEHRRERFAKRKPKATADLRARLRAMDMDPLYAWLRAELAEMSTVAAGNLEPSRGGGGSGAPPRQQSAEDDPRWTRGEDAVKRALMVLADLVLETKGHGIAVHDVSNREAARRVVSSEYRGMSCREVAKGLSTFPGVTSAFVYKVRQAQGMGGDLDILGDRISAIDGERVLDAQAPGVRRVQIDGGAR